MNDQNKSIPWQLGSDLPRVDPADDAFGYAPFASLLAEAVIANRTPQGLVLAVHGKWGSGKSSLLNFIKHDLNGLPDDRRPVVVEFNPWWFEGREQIASQLLAQFTAQLPDRLKHVRTVARLVSKYSKEIAGAAADASGYGWIKKPLAWLLGWIPGLGLLKEKTGIPATKRKIAAALKSSGKRFVFLVDDIDRLTPEEARDFFRAIKALADFPEVVYVLFFDREEVGRALSASLGMDGEAYLEKIVQAPFHLPAIDDGQIQRQLFEGLDSIIDAKPMPFPFDQERWVELFTGGLARFLEKPRDIVRVLNSLSVTYPPLAGEVNPVDFIALEFLRVFEPDVYSGIRDSKSEFCGTQTPLDHAKAEEKAYFERWRESLPSRSRERVVRIIGMLFPKVAQNLGFGAVVRDEHSQWRRELRPCSSDCSGTYFQFGVPAGRVSRAELDELVGERSADAMAARLLDARATVFPDGHSKARDLLDRLSDFDQLPPEQAAKLIEALVATAHLVLRKEDERGGFFAIPNRWRVRGLIEAQLARLDIEGRQALLDGLVGTSPGLLSLVDLADNLLRATIEPTKTHEAFLGMNDGFPRGFADNVGRRLDRASLEQLMATPDLDYVVHRWSQWGSQESIRQVFKPMVDDDDRLIELLDKFVRTGLMHSGRRTTETYRLSMTPLAAVMDVQAMEPRIQAIRSRSNLTVRQRAAADSFVRGLKLLAEGKDPDSAQFSDDD